MSKEKGEDLTEYVVTRFYRAPEIMLSSHEVRFTSAYIEFSIQKPLMFGRLAALLLRFSMERFYSLVSIILSR